MKIDSAQYKITRGEITDPGLWKEVEAFRQFVDQAHLLEEVPETGDVSWLIFYLNMVRYIANNRGSVCRRIIDDVAIPF